MVIILWPLFLAYPVCLRTLVNRQLSRLTFRAKEIAKGAFFRSVTNDHQWIVLTDSSWTVRSRTSIWSLLLSFSSLLARFLAWSTASSSSAMRAAILRLTSTWQKHAWLTYRTYMWTLQCLYHTSTRRYLSPTVWNPIDVHKSAASCLFKTRGKVIMGSPLVHWHQNELCSG